MSEHCKIKWKGQRERFCTFALELDDKRRSSNTGPRKFGEFVLGVAAAGPAPDI
ncbi:hypothetical protein SB861_62480 [Paraburkholderia sp. SIMBA_049]